MKENIKCDIGLGLDVHSEVCMNGGAERILVASQIHPIQLRNEHDTISYPLNENEEKDKR